MFWGKALAITRATFSTKLEAVNTALDAADWATARLKLAQAAVEAEYLESNLSDGGSAVSYRSQVDKVAKLIDDAETASAAHSGKARLGVVSTSHGRR